MEEGLVHGDIQQHEQGQALRADPHVPRLAAPDAPVQLQLAGPPPDQLQQPWFGQRAPRFGIQLRARLIEDEATHFAVPAEQRLQLRANPLEILQIVQPAEQAAPGLKLLVQGVAVEFVEMVLA
ncbi:hypothetical protein SSTU70S_06299 [Stutzerimonas stutzeri]